MNNVDFKLVSQTLILYARNAWCRKEGDPSMQLIQPHKEVVPPSAAAVANFFEEINMAGKNHHFKDYSAMLRKLFLNKLVLHYHCQ